MRVSPTASAPTDGIVRETAERITAGIADPRQRLRAIYDWVVDTTWRDPETPGCGFGDIKSMLRDRSAQNQLVKTLAGAYRRGARPR